MLDDKYKELHMIKSENPLIETIIGDYDNYYKLVLNIKAE